jgi:hypothetical protein
VHEEALLNKSLIIGVMPTLFTQVFNAMAAWVQQYFADELNAGQQSLAYLFSLETMPLVLAKLLSPKACWFE